MIAEKNRLDKGVFKYLYNHNSMPMNEIQRLLTNYAKDVLKIKKPNSKHSKFYSNISKFANENGESFDFFVKYFKRNKNKYFQHREPDWNDFSDIAYNNSSDDL